MAVCLVELGSLDDGSGPCSLDISPFCLKTQVFLLLPVQWL